MPTRVQVDAGAGGLALMVVGGHVSEGFASLAMKEISYGDMVEYGGERADI